MSRLGLGNPLLNKAITDVLEEEGVDPIRVMARIAADAEQNPALRLSAAKELAQYMYPKKRSLDVMKEVNSNVEVRVVNFENMMPDEAKQLEKEITEWQENKTLSISNSVAQRMMRDYVDVDSVTVSAMQGDIKALDVDTEGMRRIFDDE